VALLLSDRFREHLATSGWNEHAIVAAGLKIEALAEGLSLTTAGARHLNAHKATGSATEPVRTRSGVSGGLDLALGDDIYLNAPVVEHYALSSKVVLDAREGGLVLSSGDYECAVSPVARPSYYGSLDPMGRNAERIAQMCSADRLCYSLTGPTCSFWNENDRCQYCSIGQNAEADAPQRVIDELLLVMALAVTDDTRPARHLLLGGGTPTGDDMGAKRSLQIIKAIRESENTAIASIPIYVMIAAPLENHWIDELFEAGVDELGMNLEFWSTAAWEHYIPGKNRRIGRDRYLEALSHAGRVFGPIRARSILVAGLEPLTETAIAVKELAERGVMPIISPFRPLNGTMLAHRRGSAGHEYQDLFVEAEEITRQFDLPLGPTCAPCTNNVLALLGPR
jgi:hypothetical protein